jgi:hypothetical protein
MTDRFSKIFTTEISKEQAKDSGMALTLILLLLGFFLQNVIFYKIAIPILLINMIYPMFYYPFAIMWYGLSNLLGTIMSKVLLSLVFIILVIPIGLMRKLIGKDPLLLKKFKKSSKSVMKIRNQTYKVSDLEKPF